MMNDSSLSSNNVSEEVSMTATTTSQQTTLSLNNKLQVINDWLFEVVQDGDIPPFEKNEVTINLLYQLALYNQKQNLASNTIKNNYKQKILEYQSENKRMEHMINSTLKDTRIENNFHINQLAKVGAMLKLNNSSQGDFMDSLYELSSNYDKVMDESNELKKSIIEISDKTINLIQKSQYLNEIHQQFDQEISEREQTDSLQNRLETIEYLKRKSHEYQMQVSSIQQELNEAFSLSNNIDVQQTTLIDIYNRIQELKTEMEPKIKLIDRYHNLPPDIPQAKTKILEAREQLKQLEEVFNRKAQHIWFD